MGDFLIAWLFLAVLMYGILSAVREGSFRLASGPVSSQVRDILWFSLMCGAASAATIEVLKRIFRLRGAYQRRQTIQWLQSRAPSKEAFSEVSLELHSAMGTVRTFNLPIEQLAAQIGAAADIALSSPSRFPSLLACLADSSIPSSLLNPDRNGLDLPLHTEEDDPQRRNFVSETRIEFAQRVQSGVDQLQISVGERWRRYVQGTAVWLSGAFGIALSSTATSQSAVQPRHILAALIIGGPLAWILRDVAAVIERWRR